MKLLIYTQLILIVYYSSHLYTCLAAPFANHQIIFEGMKHGYNDTEIAKFELEKSLETITGYDNITIDSLDDNGVKWHIDQFSRMDGCPKTEIMQILSLIANNNEFTREYKANMSEEFSIPTRVYIDWAGSCKEGGYQSMKRSQVFGEPEPSGQDASSTSSSDNFSSTNLFSSESSTTLASTTTTTTIIPTTEPTEPKTTTEKATTPIIFEDPENNTITTSDDRSTTKTLFDDPFFSSSQTSTTEKGYEQVDNVPANSTRESSSSNFTSETSTNISSTGEANFSILSTTSLPDTTPAPTTTTTSTTTTPSTTTTTIDDTTTASTAAPIDDAGSSVAGYTKSTATQETTTQAAMTQAYITTQETRESASKSELESETVTEVPVSATGNTDASLQLLPPSTEGPVDNSTPHYGKYIGLGGGFIIVLAYLVCSRAYKRQGMYELQSNE